MAEIDDLKRDLERYAADSKSNKEKIEVLAKTVEDKLVEKKSGLANYFTPVLVPIYVAIIGGVFSIWLSTSQRASESRLKELQNNQDLIKDAFKGNDNKQNKQNLKFYVKSGLITSKDTASILKAINSGLTPSLQDIVSEFKITQPVNGITTSANPDLKIEGTIGSIRPLPQFTVLIEDATIIRGKMITLYPIRGQMTITESGKWYVNAGIGIKGEVNILIGLAGKSLQDRLQYNLNKPIPDYSSIQVPDSLFHILDYVAVNITN